MRVNNPGGRTSADDFIARLSSLIGDQVAGSQQLLTRFTNLVRLASQSLNSQPAGQRVDAQALLSRWLDFNLASYSAVSSHSLALMNGLLSAAESTLLSQPAAGRPAASPLRIELKLAGRPGDRAASGFLLENHFDSPIAVSFECGDLVPGAGPALPDSHVTFDPARPVIQPRASAVVNVGILLTPEFVVGQTYTTTVRLFGMEARELGLSLTVLPSPGNGRPAEGASDGGRAAKKRRKRT